MASPLQSLTTTPRQRADLQALAQTPAQEWIKTRIPTLDGGMHTDKHPAEMAPNESPLINNLALVANQLVVDSGYIPFGALPGGQGFQGTVQIAYQIFNPDGTSSVLLVTTATIYVLVISTLMWQLLPLEAYFTSTGVVGSGGNVVALSSVTGLAAGQPLGLPMDNGVQWPTTISSIAGLNVTFAPPVPAGRTVPVSTQVVQGVSLHGALDHQVAIVSYPGKSWVIISNDLDPIYYYDVFGGFLHNLVTHSDLPANTTCSAMAVFHGFLVLLNTEENGQDLPQRVRICDIGNPLSWTPAAFGGPASSLAAIYDLLDTEDFIHAASILGPYLVVYRETTLMRGTYLGVPASTIFWEYTVYGEGITGVGAISEIGSQHQFVGNAGIYQYDASYQLTEVGDPIFVNTFSAIGDLNAAAKDTVFSQYNGDYDEFMLFYPHNGAMVPDKMVRMSLEKGGWFQRFYADTFIGSSPYIPVSSTTWATAVGTWASQNVQWDSRVFMANVANIMLCSSSSNRVFLYDFVHTTDNTTAISWLMQTKDINEGGQFYRWDSVRIFGTGTVLVQYSLDSGNSFQTAGTLALGHPAPSLGILTFQAVSSYIRFQLSGTDPNFQFIWLEVWHQLESEY